MTNISIPIELYQRAQDAIHRHSDKQLMIGLPASEYMTLVITSRAGMVATRLDGVAAMALRAVHLALLVNLGALDENLKEFALKAGEEYEKMLKADDELLSRMVAACAEKGKQDRVRRDRWWRRALVWLLLPRP